MPPWVPALDSCISQSPRPHTFTFCTVSLDNRPRARTCVLRSWLFNDKSTGVLIFTTDKRSSKISDLNHNNGNFEACFYFENTSMQFRLSGFAQVLSLDQYPTMAQHPQSVQTSFIQSPPSPSFYPQSLANTPPSSDEDWFESKSFAAAAYPVYSPSWKSLHDIYSHDCGQPPVPTATEWKQEYLRIWSEMRHSAKSSFRRPMPGTALTKPSANLIDAISRGVDGTSDDVGLENFSVMVMFINGADVLADKVNRRSLYERVEGDDWVEQEVCP